MTGKVQDEKLMAYADDELTAEERSEISELLLADPELRGRVDALREAGELVRRALDGALREPLPGDLLERIETAEPAGALTPVMPLRAFPVRLVEIAVAACLLLAIGATGGYWIKGERTPGTGLDPRIGAALAKAASGTTVPLDMDGNSADVLPMLTFVDAKGRYCRQYIYRVSRAERGEAFEGVACREPTMHWTSAITVALDASASDDDSYQAASGDGQTQIDRYIETNIDGAPVTGPKEADLIKLGWPAPATKNE